MKVSQCNNNNPNFGMKFSFIKKTPEGDWFKAQKCFFDEVQLAIIKRKAEALKPQNDEFITKNGRVCEFSRQDEQTLKRWILGMLKKENKTITPADLQFFLEWTGTEMANIKTELEKLLCYTMEKNEVTAVDIEAICTKRIQNQIFEMISAIGDKNQKRALDLYYDLLTLKEPPMRILALIGRQFNLLLQVKELKKKGYSQQAIAEKTGLHGFVVGKYEKQAAGFRTSELRQALEDCVEADENVKTGKMQDGMSVEILICKYSTNKNKI